MYKIEVETEINDQLRTEWQNLWNISVDSTYFNSIHWFENCIYSFSITDYLILKIYHNKNLISIIPLEKKGHRLYCPGDKYLDKTVLLLKNLDYDIYAQILAYLKENKYSLIMNEVDQKYNSIFSETKYMEVASENPFINLDFDIKNIIKSKERRYLENIIKNNPNLTVKFYAKDSMEYMDDIFRIETKSRKNQNNKAIFGDEKVRNLFKTIAKDNYSLVAILYDNNEPIAHLFGINNRDVEFMAYHMAYVDEYRKYQPGKIVIYNLIKHLKENKFQIFDFSRGESLLKKHFSTGNRTNYNYMLNPTFIIKVKYYHRKMIRHCKKNIKQLIKRSDKK